MRHFSLLFALFFLQTLWAQSLEVVGPCEETPFATYERAEFQEQSLGAFTLEGLASLGLRYQGNERGINTIEDSVVGMDALEVLSDTEMRAYGWCFSINGQVPELFADEIPLTKVTDKVVWFFAFAHYLGGDWVAQCVPAHTVRSAKLCDLSL